MNVLIFCVYDKVAGTYGEPFVARNIGLAVRRFNFVLQNANECADDCDLYKLAVYNVETGKVLGLEKPEFICHFGEGVDTNE